MSIKELLVYNEDLNKCKICRKRVFLYYKNNILIGIKCISCNRLTLYEKQDKNKIIEKWNNLNN